MSESEGFDEGDEVEVLERLTRSYREDLSEWANMGERLVLLRLRLEERTAFERDDEVAESTTFLSFADR